MWIPEYCWVGSILASLYEQCTQSSRNQDYGKLLNRVCIYTSLLQRHTSFPEGNKASQNVFTINAFIFSTNCIVHKSGPAEPSTSIDLLVALPSFCLLHSLETFGSQRFCQKHCSLHEMRLSPERCTTRSGGPTGPRLLYRRSLLGTSYLWHKAKNKRLLVK